jgi:hypothetical protein
MRGRTKVADTFCMTCGAKLGGLDKMRGQTRCGSCRSADAAAASGLVMTTVTASGLSTVADIAQFKSMLGTLPGVRSVKVAPSKTNSGDFDYQVARDPQTDLASSLATVVDPRARVESDGTGSPERVRVTYGA